MKFNPLTDLTASQRDTAVNQLGGATGTEISNLASSVRTASQRTSQIVDLLRRDTKKTNSDLNKIMDLDRRLKTVIPIIPEKFGEAGNIFPDRQLIPEGGFQFPRIKFPKFAKTPPVRVPQPRTQPRTQTQTQKQKEKEKEKPKTRQKPQWEWQWPGPFIFPPVRDLDDLLPPVVGVTRNFVRRTNAIRGQLNAIAKSFGFDFNLDRDKLASEFAKLPEQLKAEQEKQAKAGFLQNLKDPNFLIQAIALQQTLGNLGRPGRDKFGDTAMQLNLASRFSRTANLTGRTPIVSAPAARMSQLSAPYEEIVKGLSYATREGRRIGGTTVRRRAPLMQGFETGGLYRRGPSMTPEERAMRQALMDIADEQMLKRFDDPKNVYSQLARLDVDKVNTRFDNIVEQVFGVKSKPVKKAVTSMNVLKSPRNFMNSFMEGDIAIPPGSVADILGLNNDALRKRFGYYLLQAPPGRKEQYSNFIYKISKDLGIVPGKSVNQLDENTVKFLMRFFRPSASSSTDIRPGIFKKLQESNFIEKDKLFGEFLSIDDIRNLKDPAQIPGVPDPKLLAPGAEAVSGPRSSVIGKPGTMDLASLGIDTSVEIQEIYYIVG